MGASTDAGSAADRDRLAEEVRSACLQAAIAAHDDAGLQGLCAEGRWEAAIGAIRSLDLRRIVSGRGPDTRPT